MTPPDPPRAVRVHGIADARRALAAAAELGVPVALLSAPAAAAHAGPLWFRAMTDRACGERPDAQALAVVDCADRAGDAQAALAAGASHIVFTGPEAVAHRLAAIAAAQGAAVLTARPPELDLRGVRDPDRACRAWLGGAAYPAGKPSEG